MAKIVIFSDLHAHTFSPYSSTLEDGTNSRLQDALDVITDVREIAKEVDADAVLFAGDLFHERRHIVTQAFIKVYEALSMFVVDKIPLLMIHGNHDQSDRLGRFHALKSFGAFATVVDKAGWVEFEGMNILAVPYIENANTLLDAVNEKAPDNSAPNIFLGHFGVSGAKLGADFVYSNGAEPTIGDLPVRQFDAGFLGHFHLHQELAPNFWYVGAPMHHNWGDVGQERGVMVYDTETKEGIHVPLTGTPKFVEMDYRNLKLAREGSEEGNILRIVSEKPWREDKIEETRARLGAISLEVVTTKVDVNEAFEVRLQIDPGASYEEMVAEYVASGLVDLEGLEEEWLVTVAHKILAEVSS